ncbi:uncharacterized protein DS421_6g190990 [Arachis hypogaea]|nr:uncharacterized protein DS421_6g190990 [Arachis hypogaea]
MISENTIALCIISLSEEISIHIKLDKILLGWLLSVESTRCSSFFTLILPRATEIRVMVHLKIISLQMNQREGVITPKRLAQSDREERLLANHFQRSLLKNMFSLPWGRNMSQIRLSY